MARGNQRDKAREKNQKEAGDKVRPALPTQNAQTDKKLLLEKEKHCTYHSPPR